MHGTEQHDEFVDAAETHWLGVLIHVLEETGFHDEEDAGRGLS